MPAKTSVDKALALIESDPTKILGLKVGAHTVEKGTFIPKADAQNAPSEISFSNLDQSKTFLIVGLDLDAPFPSAKFMSPIIHWIQPVTFSPSVPSAESAENNVLTAPSRPVFDYIGPSPPPFSAPHRYVFFLYSLKNEAKVKDRVLKENQSVGIGKRVRQSLENVEKEYELGECLGCNYFNSN